uniref:C2H2-type domain-containing protein n=1 Tax=Macrostomum lignano TaxID=282301 RepID=A0A1I8FSZ5_9PLAT
MVGNLDAIWMQDTPDNRAIINGVLVLREQLRLEQLRELVQGKLVEGDGSRQPTGGCQISADCLKRYRRYVWREDEAYSVRNHVIEHEGRPPACQASWKKFSPSIAHRSLRSAFGSGRSKFWMFAKAVLEAPYLLAATCCGLDDRSPLHDGPALSGRKRAGLDPGHPAGSGEAGAAGHRQHGERCAHGLSGLLIPPLLSPPRWAIPGSLKAYVPIDMRPRSAGLRQLSIGGSVIEAMSFWVPSRPTSAWESHPQLQQPALLSTWSATLWLKCREGVHGTSLSRLVRQRTLAFQHQRHGDVRQHLRGRQVVRVARVSRFKSSRNSSSLRGRRSAQISLLDRPFMESLTISSRVRQTVSTACLSRQLPAGLVQHQELP